MKSHTVSYFLFSPSNVFNFLMFIHLAIECSLWGISNCCLPSSPPEWKSMFQSLQTGRGGRTGVVGWKGGRECVWICVEGCWQQEPCWDSSLLQPLNIQKPSHQPTVITMDQWTNWLTQQLPRVYRSICECVCLSMHVFSMAKHCQWRASAYIGEWNDARACIYSMWINCCQSLCVFLSEGKMIDVCVCVWWRIGVCWWRVCHFSLVATSRCFTYSVFFKD